MAEPVIHRLKVKNLAPGPRGVHTAANATRFIEPATHIVDDFTDAERKSLEGQAHFFVADATAEDEAGDGGDPGEVDEAPAAKTRRSRSAS